MAGHSKWANIKQHKGVADARRGQVFTKLAREITVATRRGGGNPDSNVYLRLAIQKARENNMPMENIERAVKRGLGVGDGAQAELAEITYEGYGPGGAAIMLNVVTDNRTRAASEIRHVFSKAGGNLGESGSVSWVFESRGVVALEAEPKKAEEIALAAIDAGADDFKLEGSYLEVYTSPENLEQVRKAIEKMSGKVNSAEMSMVPKTMVLLDPHGAEQTLRLLDRLEELDDVQKVYTNADFPEEVLESYRAKA